MADNIAGVRGDVGQGCDGEQDGEGRDVRERRGREGNRKGQQDEMVVDRVAFAIV